MHTIFFKIVSSVLNKLKKMQLLVFKDKGSPSNDRSINSFITLDVCHGFRARINVFHNNTLSLSFRLLVIALEYLQDCSPSRCMSTDLYYVPAATRELPLVPLSDGKNDLHSGNNVSTHSFITIP